ncbi:MAG: trypsin-like peptidase domain-containing protein, partial [Planctomycetes bacterium]|nr:trypsin-like peptidase domain-containing protein [Planctomycetota bacterium]
MRLTPLFGVLALACAPLFAQDDVLALEATLQRVAKQSIPRTVLIKAQVDAERAGTGSGAIVSADGYILTATHVVEIGKTLEVVTSDGRFFPAKVVGQNRRQDFALIKIEATGLDPFPIGDSDKVKSGDWVMALGHPGGPYQDKQPAFTAGVVRALDAQMVEAMHGKFYNHAFVVDTPIFSGNSGGPLVNLDGELIGINAAIIQINELGFSIPTNQIMAQYEQLAGGAKLEGEQASGSAMQNMTKYVSPEDQARMREKLMGRLGNLFGEDSPLRNLFGEDSPLNGLFGGGGQGEMDLGKVFEQMFGEKGPFGGGQGGAPDMGKLFEDMFGEKGPFGGGQGGAPDMGKLLEDMFGEKGPFGGGQPQPERDPPAAAPAPRVYLGLRAAPQGDLPGILVEELDPDGPAAAAGLRKGD